MSEKKKTKTEGRFLCVVDINKSPTARQAYYFLKGLKNCRQDIIIDMVQKALGDDLNLDLEHMTRGELMSLYNKNVYGKQQVAQMVTPQAIPVPVTVPSPSAYSSSPASDAAHVPAAGSKGYTQVDRVESEPNTEGTINTAVNDSAANVRATPQKDPEKPTGFSRAKAARSYDDELIFQEEAKENDEPEDVEEIDDLDESFSDQDDVSSMLTNVINAGFADD